MQKIFFFDRQVFLCSEQDLLILPESKKVHSHLSKKQITEIVKDFLNHTNGSEIYISSDSYKKLLKDFLSQFKIIKASGGLVINDRGQFLGIYKRGKWDLPKGKGEKGEKHKQTAIREVAEECGLDKKDLKIIKELLPTYHTYSTKENPVLKKTYWYIMHYTGSASPIPQADEDITETRWFHLSEMHLFTENMWPSLSDVINQLCLAFIK